MTESETEGPGPEVPVEDALEQATDVEEPEPEGPPPGRPDEADPGDRAEQARPVGTGDDEYR
jgi:hypothetical protein